MLPDDVTPELATVVQRISGLPMAERMRHTKDLGEIMVIAHAVVAAESGQPVTVLIDDGPGAKIATSEIRRLQRLGTSGRSVGSITLASTLTVLGRAAGTEHLPDQCDHARYVQATARTRRRFAAYRENGSPLGDALATSTSPLIEAMTWSVPRRARFREFAGRRLCSWVLGSAAV